MAASTSVDEVDFDALNNVEESAYQLGYTQGFDHGALHGTFEGRDLGRTKGFELWEEVGFYQGLAQVWQSALQQAQLAGQSSRKQAKQLQHLTSLLRLISFFPMINTSTDNANDDTASAAPDAEATSVAIDDSTAQDADDAELAKLDMLALLEKIRAKFRLTCSVLGIQPRLAPRPSTQDAANVGKDESKPSTTTSRPDDKTVLVGGKLVDPSQLHY